MAFISHTSYKNELKESLLDFIPEFEYYLRETSLPRINLDDFDGYSI